MVDSSSIVKLTKADFDPATRLGMEIDYFDCTSCLEIPTGSVLLECPECTLRNCRECLK